MISAIRTFRKQFRLFSDHLDFHGDKMNLSDRSLRDIGLVRGGYAPRPDPYWFA
jgi:hypothetical protein